jgi:hypothetical protein
MKESIVLSKPTEKKCNLLGVPFSIREKERMNLKIHRNHPSKKQLKSSQRQNKILSPDERK